MGDLSEATSLPVAWTLCKAFALLLAGCIAMDAIAVRFMLKSQAAHGGPPKDRPVPFKCDAKSLFLN